MEKTSVEKVKDRDQEASIVAKVYVVTAGNYSDYGICAIFSKAEYAKNYIGDSKRHEIEEWPIDAQTDLYNAPVWCVKMTKCGDVLECERGTRFLEAMWSYSFKGNDLLYISLAKDKLSAIKAANDLRVQLIALERWGIFQWQLEDLGIEDLYPRTWNS